MHPLEAPADSSSPQLDPTSSIGTDPQAPFADACRQAVGALRAALIRLYDAVGADPRRPQEVARRFGLNKNLTWKVARIMQADDVFEVVSLIPGAGGLEILLSTLASHGAAPDALARVRTAIDDLDGMISRHAGDRAGLELLLDSSSPSRPLALSRKLAFRGNAGVWGIQARVRVTAKFIAPNAQQPDLLDLALVTGLLDVRRLRAVQGWPLFRFTRYNDLSTESIVQPSMAPLDGPVDAPPGGIAAAEEGSPWLMRSWSSSSLPALRAVESAGSIVYELGPGPVGRTGEFTCMFGFIERAAVPRYRDADNTHGECVSTVSLPLETSLFDVYAHRSLTETRTMKAAMYGRPFGTPPLTAPERATQWLPLAERLVELGGSPPYVATPLAPQWETLINSVFARAGWEAREFMAWRLVLEYPPLPASILLSYELPERG